MVTVIVELPVAEFGLKVAVPPLGRPLALSLTDPVKPPDELIFTV